MATGRIRLLAACLLVPLSGCSQSGVFTSKQTTNNLKASVSQLQFDNDNLKKQMAELRADNTRTENELTQERDANGELSARLDDAKELLRRKGGDATALKSSQEVDPDPVPPPYSRPPARRIKGGRKPPSVQIPRPEFDPSSFKDPAIDSPTNELDPGPQTQNQTWLDDERWLPIARGIGRPVARK